ncbi:dihydrodipicolinate synthase family protein [Calidithermus timidus]|uniref:dihydrodipicolinate synthase family protein n=1 Tax=Calidithermus timidus TaxID=307124 RepID=UPI001B7F8BA9|nr:dihydrodipicolinate synthase family protein [Calidithermus timidus]
MNHSLADLHGVVPPVVTPLTEDFQVDQESLERLVKHLLDGGVHGLFALGSTSETVFLTPQQRAEVLEVITSTVRGRVPVIAGVIDMTTALCIQHGLEAKRFGVDGLVLTAPFYTRTSQGEIMEHFRLVRRAVDLPVLAYDIPVCVHTKLAHETLATLAREGTIVGLKDSSGNDAAFRGLLLEMSHKPDFRMFTGSELTVDAALLMGAHGVVPGLGNVDPHGYRRLYDLCRAGNWSEARKEQGRLLKLFAIVNACSIPGISAGGNAMGGFKTALMLRGIIKTNVVGRPQIRYDEAGVQRVRQILEEAGFLVTA